MLKGIVLNGVVGKHRKCSSISHSAIVFRPKVIIPFFYLIDLDQEVFFCLISKDLRIRLKASGVIPK
jgi:hypothetical protein